MRGVASASRADSARTRAVAYSTANSLFVLADPLFEGAGIEKSEGLS
jgi:hypothetical protein